MHTPDGFITGWVCVAAIIIALAAIAYSAWSARKWMTKQKALLMAGLAAAVFAFQMLNFGIGNGTSGHLIGAAIAAILIAPEAAILVLASVLVIQALVYGDGGVLALGINIINMGVVAGYAAHFVYQPLKKRSVLFAGFIASMASVVAASLTASLFLGISGTIPLAQVLPAMLITHMFIGIGEGIITGGVIMYVKASKSRLLQKKEVKNISRYVVLSTIGAMAIMSLALPFASQSPDGLEKVAINLGFYEKATPIYTASPMPGYTFPGQEDYIFALISGIMGMALSFGIGYAVARPMAA